MLDTGVDIREVVNLVFAKPVFSKIKFWQMIGRGTRILDRCNIKHWCPEKENFLIIDHWNNFENFGEKPDGVIPKIEDAITTRVFKSKVARLRIYVQRSDKEHISIVTNELREMIAWLPLDSISVKERKDVVQRVKNDKFWKNIDTDYLYNYAAPLMRFLENINYNEYSFILKCEQLEIAVLNQDDRKRLELKGSIKEDLQLLPLTLQVVKKREAEILKTSSDQFWNNLTVDKIRDAKITLFPIMRYKQKVQRELILFDLDDRIVERKWIEFGA